MQKLLSFTAVTTIVVLLLTGCGGGREGTPTGEPVELPPTRTPSPASPTPSPTARPATPTPRPTRPATATPRSTATPETAPTPTPEPEATAGVTATTTAITPLGRLSADAMGQEVTVEGEIVGVESFAAGFKFTLDDGSGQVTLLMWHAIYDECWDAPELNLGSRVRVTGEVGEYEGQLQIEPQWGGAVKALEPGTPWTERLPIGSLSGANEGQRVTIEGQVVRVEGLSSAVKVFLADETGEIVVFIWRTILDRIPQNTALGTPGSQVRVVGLIEIYRSNLEIIPSLPHHVAILEAP